MKDTTSPRHTLPDLPRFRWSGLWLPLFIMAGISLLSGTSGPQLGPVSFARIDKLGHFVVFGLLAIAWVRLFEEAAFPPAIRLIAACTLVGLFGLIDECHQLLTPGRQFEWADLAADLAGAICGSASYLFIRGWRAFLELEIWAGRRLRPGPKKPHSQ